MAISHIHLRSEKRKPPWSLSEVTCLILRSTETFSSKSGRQSKSLSNSTGSQWMARTLTTSSNLEMSWIKSAKQIQGMSNWRGAKLLLRNWIMIGLMTRIRPSRKLRCNNQRLNNHVRLLSLSLDSVMSLTTYQPTVVSLLQRLIKATTRMISSSNHNLDSISILISSQRLSSSLISWTWTVY